MLGSILKGRLQVKRSLRTETCCGIDHFIYAHCAARHRSVDARSLTWGGRGSTAGFDLRLRSSEQRTPCRNWCRTRRHRSEFRPSPSNSYSHTLSQHSSAQRSFNALARIPPCRSRGDGIDADCPAPIPPNLTATDSCPLDEPRFTRPQGSSRAL